MHGGGVPNAQLGGRVLRDACAMSMAVRRRAIDLAEIESLSGRGTDRMLRVARTIADLAERSDVERSDVEEAARWRAPANQPLRALAG